jgi:hypothetical protein
LACIGTGTGAGEEITVAAAWWRTGLEAGPPGERGRGAASSSAGGGGSGKIGGLRPDGFR